MASVHRQLVSRATDGDALAVASLLERHLPGLLAFVRLHAGTELLARESSMDLVQSACREVLQDLSSIEYRSEGVFRHWLYLAAERKLVDRARHQHRARRDARREVTLDDTTDVKRLAPLYASLATPSQVAEAHEELERLEAAFRQLPDDYREVILLARIVGLNHAEIGRQMARTPQTVRVLLHRALARLARLARLPRGSRQGGGDS